MILQPSRDGGLVDLVDRILAKGVILHADLIISVSGVPLIGVNLKAAIAGMTTMMDYGMMDAWDEKVRSFVIADSDEEAPLSEKEEIVLKTFGSHNCRGTSSSNIWSSGYLYLTNKRLFLFRKKPAKILFETPVDCINEISVTTNECFQGKKEVLLLSLQTGQSANNEVLLYAEEIDMLKRKLEEKIKICATP